MIKGMKLSGTTGRGLRKATCHMSSMLLVGERVVRGELRVAQSLDTHCPPLLIAGKLFKFIQFSIFVDRQGHVF